MSITLNPRRTRPTRRGLRKVLVTISVVSLATLTACGVTSDGGDAGGDLSDQRLRMMIPNAAGGGYDLTGRAAVKVMEDENLADRFEVSNVEGASGTVAMQRLLNEEGSDDLLMTMGLGVIGAVYTNQSDATVDKAIPIARLIEEQEAILVPADSPFTTVNDFVEAWKADPDKLIIGGGSAPGGPDHLFPMQLADAVGVTPSDVAYVEYDGGGPLTTALLGSKIDVGMSGLGEFAGQIEDGSLRVLAVSGAERLDTADAPTLTEEGIDLVFTNWRGVLAPPGIDDATVDAYIAAFEEMHDTQAWKDVLEENGWSDNFATGDEFDEFLTEQNDRVRTTLTDLGLA
ncbi:Bug family tripartite tricarboxylate transporter substrate binding protein [Nocardioides zhouii]|uniref:Tripartite tricarboxylate transporter substrate binding protein n=1 Tax=Nocardioides zhouii TaxID=1168729 RepID=A0A4Q2T089_9ACTN|nr:tripartite tricarboxylate transporter substrate-binding protein [Nocardioides zhouii]RYC11261.1 tripartite tricarboxylate transporter substrate binding protein [Nocardioides zhouii]